MNRIKIRKGISLIEVVIALGISSYLMAETYKLVSEAVYYQKEAISLSNAVFLAKIKMAQIDSSVKLETTSSKGDIVGYNGYKYEVEIKEEELDLLKLAEKKDSVKPPSDMMGKDSMGKVNELLEKRGKSKGSTTGGLIKVFRIKVAIIYPSGGKDLTYEVETFKSSTF
jgi:general secretion pathway protein I